MKYLDVVMTRLPGPESDFIELEDENCRGVGKPHEWVHRADGHYALRIYLDAPAPEPLKTGIGRRLLSEQPGRPRNRRRHRARADGWRSGDHPIVRMPYLDSYGRRHNTGRWIVGIGWPIEVGRGVKVYEKQLGKDAYDSTLWEVAAIGRDGSHLVVNLRVPRVLGCTTYWPTITLGLNVPDEPWLMRTDPKKLGV